MSRNIVSARLKGSNGEYDRVSIRLSQGPIENDGERLIHFRFAKLDSEEYSDTLQELKDEYEMLLGMENCIILTFDTSEQILNIFRQCGGQRMSLFTGSLSEWRGEMLDRLDASSMGEFDLLCREFESGKKYFFHYIQTNAFFDESKMQLCDIRCQTIQHPSGKCKVLGRIALCGDSQNNAGDMSQTMDAGIPVLNKKAITEYAKKIMVVGDGTVYLVILDLDDFKSINDTFGHMFGDEVLSTTAEIIKSNLGDCGMVGRIGGDEMLLVLTRVESNTELRNVLRSIRVDIEWTYKDKRENLHVTCSMGVAAYPSQGDSFEDVFQLADRMLYIAKKKGKNRYVIYTPEIHDGQESVKQQTVAGDLEKLRDDKTGVMERLVERFLMKRVVTYETELNEIGYCFELDEIMIVGWKAKEFITWDRTNGMGGVENSVFLQPEDNFEGCFDASGVYAANSIFNLEGKLPSLAAALTEKGIESVLFYKLSDKKKMSGYVMFAQKEQRQMWAEYEKTMLAVVGKAIELSLASK